MSLFSLIILSLALSIDCFTICMVFGMQRAAFRANLRAEEKDPMPPLWWSAVLPGLVFALFHILMILLGWLLGWSINGIVEKFDHWFAFALLCGIGFKTIIEAYNSKEKELQVHAMFHWKSLLLLGLAVSIDAFAVGVSLEMLNVGLVKLCASVALTVLVCSIAAVFAGFFLQKQLRKLSLKAVNLIGGLVLIGIGVRILIEHLQG